tara:strand:- start:325 stop:894 length:570 start_codon:yes stop_codon:yes gene_type:complete
MEKIIPKTGLGDIDTDSLDEDQKINITALLTVFMENSLDSAAIYVKKAGRKTVTSKDISMALKRQVFTFLNTENLEEKAKQIALEYKNELNQNLVDELTSDDDFTSDNDYYDEKEDDEDDEEDDSDKENDVHEEDEEEEEFTYCYADCKICKETNEYSEKWKTFKPSSKIEQILYDGIQKIDSNFNLSL